MTITCEVRIEGTETAPPAQARSSLLELQRRLTGTLRPKVALLTQLNLGPEDRERAQDALARFCDGPLRSYLDACDRRLYAALDGEPQTRLLVLALRTNAAMLRRHLDVLPNADEAPLVTSLAEAIDTLLTAHLAIERTVLLPALPAHAVAGLLDVVSDLEDWLGGVEVSGGAATVPAVACQ